MAKTQRNKSKGPVQFGVSAWGCRVAIAAACMAILGCSANDSQQACSPPTEASYVAHTTNTAGCRELSVQDVVLTFRGGALVADQARTELDDSACSSSSTTALEGERISVQWDREWTTGTGLYTTLGCSYALKLTRQ